MLRLLFRTPINNIGSTSADREINWRKVDEHRAKGLSWSAVSRDGHPLSTLLAAQGRREDKED